MDRLHSFSICFHILEDLPSAVPACVPVVSCPSGSHPNDNLFLFCQMCGYRRKTVPQKVPSSKISVNLQAIDDHLEHMKKPSLQSLYFKQKGALRTEFVTFLGSFPNSKTILSASPTDITRFLVWKTGMVKRWCILMGVPTPNCRVQPSANVQNAWRSKQSTPT